MKITTIVATLFVLAFPFNAAHAQYIACDGSTFGGDAYAVEPFSSLGFDGYEWIARPRPYIVAPVAPYRYRAVGVGVRPYGVRAYGYRHW
jgi:hypothetical protein